MRAARRGMSIIEVSISMTICAMLLTAVSISFCASAQLVNENDEFNRATQATRIAMNQMLAEIRRAHSANVVGSMQLSLVTFDGYNRTYTFDPGTRKLTLHTDEMTLDHDPVLAENVSSCTFNTSTRTDSGGITVVTALSITLDIAVGNNHLKLNGAAALRREVQYD